MLSNNKTYKALKNNILMFMSQRRRLLKPPGLKQRDWISKMAHRADAAMAAPLPSMLYNTAGRLKRSGWRLRRLKDLHACQYLFLPVIANTPAGAAAQRTPDGMAISRSISNTCGAIATPALFCMDSDILLDKKYW